MGTIQKRTDNPGKVTYQAKFRRVGFPPKSKTFPTRAEAKAWLEQTESVLNTATQDEAQLAAAHTFGDLMRRYAKEVSPTKKTGDAEAARLLTICRKPIAKYSVDNLTTQVFAEYRDERLKKVTGSTVNREFMSCTMCWRLPGRNGESAQAAIPYLTYGDRSTTPAASGVYPRAVPRLSTGQHTATTAPTPRPFPSDSRQPRMGETGSGADGAIPAENRSKIWSHLKSMLDHHRLNFFCKRLAHF